MSAKADCFPTLGTRQAKGHSTINCLFRHFEEDRQIELLSARFEQMIEALRLCNCAWKSIEQKRSVHPCEPCLHHLHDQIVCRQSSCADNLLCLNAKRRATFGFRTQNGARGGRGNAKPFLYEVCLSFFSGSRGT